jgi:cell division protein FtsW
MSNSAKTSFRESIRTATGIDQVLVVITLFLMGLGIVMVYSTTIHSVPGGTSENLLKHVGIVGISIVAMLAAVVFPLDQLRRLSGPLLAVLFILMIVVLVWGSTVGNSTRWLDLVAFKLQPGELAKLAFVIWMAHMVAKKNQHIRSIKYGLIPYLIVASAFMALFRLQPDFGSMIFILALLGTILFIAGLPKRTLAVFMALAVGLAALLVIINPMRMGRVLAFLDPENTELTASYHIMNALIAISSNGLGGAGLGNSRQNISGLLPEAHTDFVFSVVSEELGFAGAMVVIASFLFILYRGTAVAFRTKDPFMRYLAFGLTVLVVAQAVVHIGGNAKLMPIKGLPLPLVSQGGSNLLTVAICLGLILNVSRHQGTEPTRNQVQVPPPSPTENEVLTLRREE